MKHRKIRNIMFVLLTVAVGSCSALRTPAHRDEINREMPLVVQYESKTNNVKREIGVFSFNGMIDNDISLARGEMKEYRAYVALAEKELEQTKSALTTRIHALHQ